MFEKLHAVVRYCFVICWHMKRERSECVRMRVEGVRRDWRQEANKCDKRERRMRVRTRIEGGD